MPDFPAPEVFCHNVRLVLAQRAMTITSLAELVGISQPSMSKIIAGKEGVTLARAERIAKALGLPLSALVSEKFEQTT